MIDIHTRAKKVGNSWAIIIPKENADKLQLSKGVDLHVDIEVVPSIHELIGTFKTKRTTDEIKEGIKRGWKG